MKRIVRTKEAAEYLTLAEITLEVDRCKGTLGIPFYRVGRTCLYDLDELDQWFATRKAKRADPGETALPEEQKALDVKL